MINTLKPAAMRLLITACCTLTLLTTNAQTTKSWHFGFGISAGKPTKEPFQFSLGGDIRVQKDFSDHLSGTFTAGFTHWFEKDHFNGYNQYGSPYNVIPVKAGIKYFPTKNFYLGAEAGAGFGMEEWGTSFLWSPSIGYAFNNSIDISVKYEDFTRSAVTKQVALRLAYGFENPKFSIHKKNEAEKKWQFGVDVTAGQVANSFEGTVLGVEAGLYRPLSANLELVANAGMIHYFKRYQNYYDFVGPDYLIGTRQTAQNAFPVKAGLRLYAGDKFYLEGQAGAAFASKSTSFLYAPSIGLLFKSGIDIGLKYEDYDSIDLMDQAAVRIGYRF